MPKGERQTGRRRSRYTNKKPIGAWVPPPFASEDEAWVRERVAMSPLSDKAAATALAQGARVLQLQLQDLRSRLGRWSVDESKTAEKVVHRLGEAFGLLRITDKVEIDDSPI